MFVLKSNSCERRDAGCDVHNGDLSENVTSAGFSLERLPLGTRIQLGPTATVELTGLRTPCVLIDRFWPGLKRDGVSPEKTSPPFKCGVMGVVRVGGRVAARDPATALLPQLRSPAVALGNDLAPHIDLKI